MTSVPQAQTSWPDRVRLPLRFDPARLAADWSALPLRAHAAARHRVQMIYSPPYATEFVDTRCWRARPISARCSPPSAAR